MAIQSYILRLANTLRLQKKKRETQCTSNLFAFKYLIIFKSKDNNSDNKKQRFARRNV